MSKNVIFEYFMLDLPTEWDKEKREYVVVEKNQIIRVERENLHYKELCLGIDAANALLSDMDDRNYYTPIKGDHCKRCFYRQECDEMTRRTEVHTTQVLLSDMIKIEKPKNYIIPDSIPIIRETKQTEFDFMRGIKNKRKPT